jgi:hypothetical protein
LFLHLLRSDENDVGKKKENRVFFCQSFAHKRRKKRFLFLHYACNEG